MLDTDKQLFNDFWLKFDNTFHDSVEPEVAEVYKNLFFKFPNGFDYLADKWTEHRNNGTFPDGFKNEIETVRQWIPLPYETIMSIIKRLFGEHIMSRLTRTQNRELSFR
jgi:hypothetical protein